MQKRKRLFIGLGLVSTLALTAFVAVNEYFEVSKNLEIHADLYKELHNFYVDETNPGQLMKTGIDAMLASLDPYTVYYPENTIEDARVAASGSYGGIGSSFRVIDNRLIIAYPYENSPAAKSGLQSGDMIVAVNGKDVSKLDIGGTLQLLKGAAGSNVEIKIQRDGEEKSFQLQRADIKINVVPYSGFLNESTGYIKLSRFSDDAYSQVRTALTNLKSSGNLKGLVFDLRGNPGGLLREAIQICNLFIPKGKLVVSTKGKIQEWNKEYGTTVDAFDEQLPIVVLVDRRSASASEIVAGVLQDYDRAVIVGNKSFGKGLVQTTRFLKYNSQLKVTVSKYYTPSGRCIQAIDYGKKENGTALKINAKNQQEFKTAGGRKVYDGGGVMPDVEVFDDVLNPITMALISQNLIFKYASHYKANHSSISDKENFSMSDNEYAEFIKFVQNEGFTMQTNAEKTLNQLKGDLKSEPAFAVLMNDWNKLSNQIQQQKIDALQTHKSQIKPLIEAEIVARYYFSSGKLVWELKHDKDVAEAIKILGNQAEYKKILSPSFAIPRFEMDTLGAKFVNTFLEELPEDIED